MNSDVALSYAQAREQEVTLIQNKAWRGENLPAFARRAQALPGRPGEPALARSAGNGPGQDSGGALKVFDSHQHLGSLQVVPDEVSSGSGAGWGGDPEQEAVQRSAHLDRFGITSAALMPTLQYERPYGIKDTMALNDRMAEFREKNHARFPVAFGTVEPLYGVKICLEEIRRAAEELRLDGFVWHNRFQGTHLADRRMHALVETLAEYGLPAFVHVMAESTLEAPWALEELASAHPDVTLVACDAFSGITQVSYMNAIAERCGNVLFDTAWSIPLTRPVETFARRFGPQRLLFGTDVYSSPDQYAHCHVLDELKASELSEEAISQIVWGNAARLFGLADQ